MDTHLILWGIFIFLFAVVFTIDMYVTDHRKGEIKVKSALKWTSMWIGVAILYSVIIYFSLPDGYNKAFEFVTGYIIEYSLSVDNLFVFIMIFSVMGISQKNQPRILKWGILGAVVLRILFIVAGVGILHAFHFMIYVFGAVLVFTAYKMFRSSDEKIDPQHNVFVKLASRAFKIKTDHDSDHFFVKENGTLYATIAFITLVLIESTDVVFAIDSIPAVLAITQDSFIAITSNLFAILGLRSLFFALAGVLNLFRYLKYGISFILLFIGVKMLISGWYIIPVQASLIVILLTLTVSILASVLIKEADDEEAAKKEGKPIKEEAEALIVEE